MVYDRIVHSLPTHSCFLFGPRGTGKSTLLERWKSKIPSPDILSIDLLNPEEEEQFLLRPARLRELLEASPEASKDASKPKVRWCMIDEIQKVPALLDVVHWALQRKLCQFILTGSSARKLKRNNANLLAGRAFDLHLHPLTERELGTDFDLNQAINYGTLPEVFSFSSSEEKQRFLTSYTRTYLKEEIQVEQIVRNVQRFRKFLSFAAQMNTKILNFSKLSHASGVDPKSINRYFEILEDTLVGHLLEPYDLSVRRRQTQKPKFYLFDTGISRSLREDLVGEAHPRSSVFGELFEQWFFLECLRYRDYYETGDEFFYLQTKDQAEIDLIIHRKGIRPILIEIKSTETATPEHVRHLERFSKVIKHSRAILVCRESKPRKLPSGVEILPYRSALEELFPKRGRNRPI
jgi:predicted AAA+ superfamily ATPase